MENYSVDEIMEANRRIAAYNMAQQEYEEDVLLLCLLKARKKKKKHSLDVQTAAQRRCTQYLN